MQGERLDALLADIAARSDLPVRLDGNGSCTIVYGEDSELTLTSVEGGDEVLLHAPLQFLSPRDPLPQLRRAMALSLYGTHSAGAGIGLDKDGGWLVLWRRLPIEGLDGRSLEARIVGFALAADQLRSQLGPHFSSEPNGPPAEADPGFLRL